MTTFTTNYSFMDLLKDKSYISETDQVNSQIMQDIEGAFDAFTDLVKISEDYDFMNLLKDHGYVPANDNYTIEQIAS